MDAQLHRAQWRKSTYSGQNGDCVEVAAWRKATYSSQNGACVEVAHDLPRIVAVRDSKDPGGPRLAFAPERWRAFTRRVKDGGANPV
jgi:Domain of unknown function (DUF397)